MPKIEKEEPSAPPPPRANPAKPETPEDRLEALNRKLARLNKDAELLGEAMRGKPKKA